MMNADYLTGRDGIVVAAHNGIPGEPEDKR